MPGTQPVETNEKLCLDCGKTLGPGKLGKKYCDEYCKSNYHNRMNREKKAVTPEPEPANAEIQKEKPRYPEHLNRIHEVLIKNREIMSDICDEDRPCHIRMRNLLGRGFNPKYFTSQSEPTGQGNIYHFCYEYGYRDEGDGMVVVICRPREIYF